MSNRKSNENRFKKWVATDMGGRIYSRRVNGQYGWYVLYIKEVNADEEILTFRQEVYNEQNELVEIHEKYPIDKGHKTIKL